MVILMQIDLLKLNYQDEIKIDEEVNIPKDMYINTDINELKDVKAIGNITLDEENNYFVNLDLSGVMVLNDSITNDLVPYEFNVKIEESLENSIKTLDLISFLWHYIVLEIPLRYTLHEGNYPEGENFRVISEEEYSKSNNPFNNFRIE